MVGQAHLVERHGDHTPLLQVEVFVNEAVGVFEDDNGVPLKDLDFPRGRGLRKRVRPEHLPRRQAGSGQSERHHCDHARAVSSGLGQRHKGPLNGERAFHEAHDQPFFLVFLNSVCTTPWMV